MAYWIKTRDEHYQSPGPKRILAIDGGGLRGIFSLQLLKRIEDILKARYGDDFRLGHYFDLFSGTSTGSVIAASLALGMTVDEVIQRYEDLGHRVFKKTFFRRGAIRAKYDKNKLVEALKNTFGEDAPGDYRVMGSEAIQSGLMVMTKRRDTGSPWPISNNPQGAYFAGDPDKDYIPNKDYPLWSVVRASTAAPAFFKGETIEIARQTGKKPVIGQFVDGGVSPHNNPALQAVMYATLEGHKINWPLGADRLLLISLGTGSRNPGVEKKMFEAQNAIKSLVSMMDDCNDLVQIMLQWMSAGLTAKVIDREMGDLHNDLIAPDSLLTYVRYNQELSGESLSRELGMNLDEKTLKKLAKMDVPENMPVLAEIGRATAEKAIDERHFPAAFDLEEAPAGNQPG